MTNRAQHAPVEGPPTPEAASPRGQLVEYDEFIENQLRKTRSHVRGVDIAAGVMMLVAGSLAFFFVAALGDHWLIAGGLGFWSRLLLLIVFLAGTGWWIGTQIAPLAFKRINPLYAAYTIERSRPTLKNALVNFLMFRANPVGVHQKVFEAIEEQAATRLVGVPVESAVDRSRLIKLGYVLVGILLVCALYAIVSPKSPFQTVGRVAMPWADIAPPTRTTIDEISPGDAQAFRGQQVTVKARVQGLPEGAKVVLYYTTADRQIVDRTVEMNRPPDDYRHAAVLPAGDGALQQTLSYRIAAGDAVSRTHTIEVVAAPTIVVRAIEYNYPSYTGLLRQRVEHQGDIKALEGTEITLEALANQNIAAAHVDFDCDRKLDLRMAAQQQTASVKFGLALGEDRQTPLHASYQLSFKNAAGQQNPQPVRHPIEVTRDLAPEIQFVAPKRDEIDLPLNAAVDLEVVAGDPDFALSSVKIVASRGDETLVDQTLLDKAWTGQFGQKYRFQPRKLGLAAGDVVDYYAVAVDNKSPRPNQAETSRRRIRIISPADAPEKDQLAQNDRRQSPDRRSGNDGQRQQNDHPREPQPRPDEDSQPENSGDNQQPEDAARQPRDKQSRESGKRSDDAEPVDQDREQPDAPGQQQDGGERGDKADDARQADGADDRPSDDADERAAEGAGEGGAEEPADEQPVPSDGTDDGDAFDRILKHRRDQQQHDADDQQQPPAGDDAGGQERGGSDGQEAGQGSQQQNSSPDSNGEQQDRQSSDKNRQGQNQRSGNQDAQQRDAADGDDKSGNKPSDPKSQDQQSRDRQDGQRQSDDQQRGPQQRGDRQAGDQKSQDQQSGDQKAGDQKSDDQKPGDQKAGERQQKSDQPSDRSQSNEDMPPQDAQQKGQSGDSDSNSQSGNRDQQSKGKSSSGDRSQQQDGQQDQSSDAGADQSGDAQGQQGTKQQPGEPGQSGDQPKAGERQAGEGTDSQGEQAGDKQQSGEPDGQPDRPSGATRDNNTSDDGTPQDSSAKGQGAQSKDDPMRSKDQQPRQDGEQRPDARGGDGEQEKGPSGAGQKSKDNKGSPSPQESSSPRSKSPKPDQDNGVHRPDKSEQSPSNSKRESDSQGDQGGDRSGGGEKGGGQKANKPGTGGAGQNTAADEGAGKSEQAGDGETSGRKGDDQQADRPTGQSGSQQGDGSQSRPADGPNSQPGGDQPGEPSSNSTQGQDGSRQGSGSQAGENPSEGRPGQRREQQWKPGTDSADEANLEYTRKATDLALEHLKDQMKNGDGGKDLLDDLGWTRQDAERFVKRWESLRQQAGTPSEQESSARRELDQTLRSLGLRPKGSSLKSSAARDDRSQGFRESSHTTPPAEYSEAFKAYTQGTARGGK